MLFLIRTLTLLTQDPTRVAQLTFTPSASPNTSTQRILHDSFNQMQTFEPRPKNEPMAQGRIKPRVVMCAWL